MVNHLNTFSDTNCNVLNYKQKKENLSTYVLDNGIWSEVDSFVSWGKQKLSGNSNDYYTNLSDVLTIMENITDYTSDSKPTFTFAYAECPHEYFTFDADGNRIAKEDETNWKDKSIYLNQYKYITKCMERIVEDIQKNDPDVCPACGRGRASFSQLKKISCTGRCKLLRPVFLFYRDGLYFKMNMKTEKFFTFPIKRAFLDSGMYPRIRRFSQCKSSTFMFL